MVKIKKQLVSDTPFKSGRRNTKRLITWHLTGNTGRGANAQAHANLQSRGNSRKANWHWQVDDKVAIQSFTHDFQLWHAGDGGYGSGTLESIAIEGCVNSDGDYNKMIQNMIELTVHIMKEENIKTVSNVVTHNWWSGKWCPAQILDGLYGKTYNYMIRAVERLLGAPTETPTPPTADRHSNETIATQVINGMWGNGDERRTRLSNAGYDYKVIQDIVNNIIHSKDVVPPLSNIQKPTYELNTDKTIQQMADEVIAGLHGNGVENRRRSLNIGKSLYQQVQNEVNRRMGVGNETVGKSVETMAQEIARGEHGNGHANRRRSLGISDALYQRVRARVNQMFS